MNNIFEKIGLTVKLSKIFGIYFFFDLATNELQTMCQLAVQDRVAEQHVLGKYSKCNSFRVTMNLLNIKNFKVVITQL